MLMSKLFLITLVLVFAQARKGADLDVERLAAKMEEDVQAKLCECDEVNCDEESAEEAARRGLGSTKVAELLEQVYGAEYCADLAEETASVVANTLATVEIVTELTEEIVKICADGLQQACEDPEKGEKPEVHPEVVFLFRSYEATQEGANLCTETNVAEDYTGVAGDIVTAVEAETLTSLKDCVDLANIQAVKDADTACETTALLRLLRRTLKESFEESFAAYVASRDETEPSYCTVSNEELLEAYKTYKEENKGSKHSSSDEDEAEDSDKDCSKSKDSSEEEESDDTTDDTEDATDVVEDSEEATDAVEEEATDDSPTAAAESDAEDEATVVTDAPVDSSSSSSEDDDEDKKGGRRGPGGKGGKRGKRRRRL